MINFQEDDANPALQNVVHIPYEYTKPSEVRVNNDGVRVGAEYTAEVVALRSTLSYVVGSKDGLVSSREMTVQVWLKQPKIKEKF